MFEVLTFIVVVIIIFGVIIENIRLKNKNTELIFMLSQSLLDLEGVKKNVITGNKQDDIEKDHLITFLSETREIAFSEIEKIQQALKDFIELADKEFAYFDKYGLISETYPNYETMKIISKEYKKLKMFLPVEGIDGR